VEPDRWSKIEDLYHAAAALEGARRDAFLRESCADDASLRVEVEELLQSDSRAGGFIETPALQMLARQEARALEATSGFRLDSGAQLGPYEIVKPLGAGGMGEIYSARDTRLGRTVAVKILGSRMMDQAGFRERLEREARAVSNLNHPHICPLHDIGRDQGIDYLVMEFVEGESLAERLKRGPLAGPEVLRIAIEIAGALDYAHRQGVIHRDLKPGNIMLTARGAKLVDFGLARGRDDPSRTQAGAVMGTPQYMAPEQAARGRVDARADIFALGAVIFEMATGRKALDGAAGSNAKLPAALKSVVVRCLKTAPEQRWQSAGDLIVELNRIDRAARSPVRRWMAAGAAAILLAAGVWVLRAAHRPAVATEQVLHSFTGENGDGANSAACLTKGSNGNLYGATSRGGAFGKGVVYEVRPPASAGAPWVETVVYSFTGGIDGDDPFSMPVAGKDGVLYGNVQRGGEFGKGAVYELTPPASGGRWSERVLHSFTAKDGDGYNPRPALIMGKDGALYGTTTDGGLPGGDNGFGIVFRLTPPAVPGGEWVERVLYKFTGANGDGANPFGNVAFGPDGALYGTTFGGPSGPGTIYRLSLPERADGTWTETVLHNFPRAGDDGRFPVGDLAIDADGVIYGTTQWGGISNNGIVFQLKPPLPGGAWAYSILHRFGTHMADGSEPTSGLLLAGGSVYGTAVKGGTWGNGAVFKLTPDHGSFAESVLFSFTNHQGEGGLPKCTGRLLLDRGALYGTTEVGGTSNLGTVFQLTLPKGL
jgi:uncharacterized repeat protein (TIGR03803 family)